MKCINTERLWHKGANQSQVVLIKASTPELGTGQDPHRACCSFLQSFKGYEQCTVTDPVGGIFALFIICFLYKLLLNGKQMQTHQVCEQMVLLYDEEKMRVRGTASLEKMAFSPAPPIVCWFPPCPPPVSLSSLFSSSHLC